MDTRIVHVRACAICDKDVSRYDRAVFLSTLRGADGIGWHRVHADCLRPFLSEHAKWFVDPDELASESERPDAPPS